MEHTTPDGENDTDKCDCPPKDAIPYLDTLLSVENGKIEIDLYKKPTDRNQYLLPSSNHPKGTVKSIPFSQALRIIRICTNPTKRDIKLEQLKMSLLERNYPIQTIENAIEKAKKVPRSRAIQMSKKKEKEKRPVFALDWDPRLPCIQQIQAKHHRSMVSQDQYLAQVFPKPPLTAFRRENNLRSLLIRSKVPIKPKLHQERKIKGMKKCGKQCPTCPFILEEKSVKISEKEKWTLNNKYTCESYNLIYMIECEKQECKMRYIGQTKRALKYRMAEHRGYVSSNADTPTGSHFNLPGHDQANMKVIVLERVKKEDKNYREVRETYLINKFNTFYMGLNKKK